MSENQDTYTDRRKHARVELATPMKYTVVMPSKEAGMVRDVSEGGLCVVVNRQLASGSTLLIEFDLPGDKPEHIEALTKVMWQRSLSDGKYSLGLKFLT